VLLFCVVLLCDFTFLVPCSDVRYDFYIKAMFGSSLPPVVCRTGHVLFRMFGSSLPPVVCRMGHVLFRMFGSSLPLVVCRMGHVLFRMFGSSLPPVVPILQTTGGKDEPNILNKR
jgi:hypothetical protein